MCVIDESGYMVVGNSCGIMLKYNKIKMFFIKKLIC